MSFLSEFGSPTEVANYEEQLKKGVYIIGKGEIDARVWYLLERNQQILFQKIQKLAEVFSRAIPVEEPSIPGWEGGIAKGWSTVSTNQGKLSVALDYLIAESKCFKPSPPSVICHTDESTPNVGCGRGNWGAALFNLRPYYDEQLKKGVFVFPKPLADNQDVYIVERNQQILFQKIQKLARVFFCVCVIPDKELSIRGVDNNLQYTTVCQNQKVLYDAFNDLLQLFKQSPPCTPWNGQAICPPPCTPCNGKAADPPLHTPCNGQAIHPPCIPCKGQATHPPPCTPCNGQAVKPPPWTPCNGQAIHPQCTPCNGQAIHPQCTPCNGQANNPPCTSCTGQAVHPVCAPCSRCSMHSVMSPAPEEPKGHDNELIQAVQAE